MVAQDIINSVSRDVRQVMSNSGDDAIVMLGWVDRTQKDVLHSSIYVNQNLATLSVNTAVNTSSYTMVPATAIRRIVSVFDNTFNMSLTPSDVDLDTPTPMQAKASEDQGKTEVIPPLPHQAYKFGGTPEYYRFIAPTTLLVRPAPQSAAYVSTLNVVYEKQVATVLTASTALLVPDDGKDVMCAGVNWMAMAYIGRPQEAMSWFQLYNDLKGGRRVGVIR